LKLAVGALMGGRPLGGQAGRIFTLTSASVCCRKRRCAWSNTVAPEPRRTSGTARSVALELPSLNMGNFQ